MMHYIKICLKTKSVVFYGVGLILLSQNIELRQPKLTIFWFVRTPKNSTVAEIIVATMLFIKDSFKSYFINIMGIKLFYILN